MNRTAPTSSAIGIVLFTILLTIAAIPAAAADSFTAVCFDSLARLPRSGALPNGKPNILICAARGEAEAFQVVIVAKTPLQDVTVAASDFAGPGTIPTAAILLYREVYVPLTHNSPRASEPPDWFADPLLPLSHPWPGDAGAGQFDHRFDVAAGENQPIWVEVKVPRDAAPGLYRGVVSIVVGVRRLDVPFRLKVWDFELPQTPALATSFGVSTRDDLEREYGIQRHTAPYFTMTRRFVDFLLDHRLSPVWADDMQVDGDATGRFLPAKRDGTLGSTADVYRHYFEDKGMTAITAPFWDDWPYEDPLGTDREVAKTYLRNFAAFARKLGFADRIYVYPVDEPGSAAQYELVRQWAAFFHEAGPEFRFLLTEQPRPQNPAWGTLTGFVDIWVPLTFTVQPEESWARVAAGDEMWTYTALVQNRYAPVWLMDRRPVEHRIFPWIMWHYGMTGLLYWEMTYYEQVGDPWQGTASYDGHNGDGMFIYPGRRAEHGFDGPVASLRLKWLRDSVDDYDYLVLLANLAGRGAVDKLANKVGTRWNVWNKDPQVLLKQRIRIGKKIEKLTRKNNK